MTPEPGGAELDRSRSGLPGPSEPTAAGTILPSRRRRSIDRVGSHVAPYALLLPATAVIAAVLAYPLYKLGALSLQQYGLKELLAGQGVWIGFENYQTILGDRQFWEVLLRTILFTTVCVSLTMVFGTLIAILLTKLGSFMRLLLTTGLVLVWAMPVVVAISIWRWMVDYEFGVLNWLLTELHLGNFVNHDWFADPKQGFLIISLLVVWGAIPFVAITIYAGLSQLPRELVEAASIDGAPGWRVFFDVTLPLLKPIFVILTSLSIIWDFQVFNQVWIMRDGQPSPDYFLMSTYSFVESFKISQYGLGSAIAVVMVVIMFGVTFVYIRQMVRIGETR